jgi:hypothetical protein
VFPDWEQKNSFSETNPGMNYIMMSPLVGLREARKNILIKL